MLQHHSVAIGEHRVVEGVLAVEVHVQRRCPHAHGLRDVAQRPAGQTALAGQPPRGVDDLALRRGMPDGPSIGCGHGRILTPLGLPLDVHHNREHSPNDVRKVDIQEAMMRTGTQPTSTREDLTMRHRDWMAAAEEEYRRLGVLLAELDEEDWQRPTDCTEWDVREMVAHLVGAAASTASVRETLRQSKLGRALRPGGPERRRDQRAAGARARPRHSGAAALRPGRQRRPRGAVAAATAGRRCAPSRCPSARRSAPGRSAT